MKIQILISIILLLHLGACSSSAHVNAGSSNASSSVSSTSAEKQDSIATSQPVKPLENGNKVAGPMKNSSQVSTPIKKYPASGN